MKLNFNFKPALYTLMLMAGFAACTSETEFQTEGGEEQPAAEGGIHFVIQTPSPDAVVSRAETVKAEDAENKVNKMSLYIFAQNKEEGEADTDYTLLNDPKEISFGEADVPGTPGTSGTTGADGTLTYTEPITAGMIGKKVKILLVANDKVEATKDLTTLADFKKLAASITVNDGNSSDVISTSGIVMSAVAYKGATPGQEEAVTLTPLGVDMKASFERIVARIDLIHAIPNMTLTGVKVLNASSKGHLFKQEPLASPGDASKISLTPTSEYTGQLSGGIAYKPKEGVETDDDVTAKNTLKHMFYLYEQPNAAGENNCVTVEIYYKLQMGNWLKPGKLQVEFKKAEGDYVATTRNTVYTIQMGNGEEATDVNNVTTIKVLDWTQEAEIEETFKPTEDSHSEIITDLSTAQIGDFYMADGTLRRADYQFMESEKAQVIGIVFHKYTGDGDTRFGAAEKEALSDKGVTTPHGLVMAVKEATVTGTAWGPNETNETTLTDIITLKATYEDVNGLANYNAIKGTDTDFTNHKAFKAVADFAASVPAPQSTTGWFLPSSGQWWDIVANLGGEVLKNKLAEMQTNESLGWYAWHYDSSADSDGDDPNRENITVSGNFYAQQNINKHLSKLGSHADLFNESIGTAYWTSSEYSSTLARRVGFLSTHFDVTAGGKTNSYYVRAVLAF